MTKKAMLLFILILVARAEAMTLYKSIDQKNIDYVDTLFEKTKEGCNFGDMRSKYLCAVHKVRGSDEIERERNFLA